MYKEAYVKQAHQTLKWAYAIVILIVALDKVLGTWLVVDWAKYVAPQIIPGIVPIPVHLFITIVGVIELIVGIAFLTKWSKWASYAAIVWLVIIAIDLLMIGYIDIAARDLLLAVGAYAKTRLDVASEN